MPDDPFEPQPETEPHPAPIFDTGPHPQPLPPGSGPMQRAEPEPAVSSPAVSSPAVSSPATEPRPAPAAPVLVPGQYHFLKWWKLVLALVAVWVPAAGVGLGLFSWWYSLVDKTPAVFVVLIYLAVSTVAGVMLAMVPDRPMVSAFAIAVMSAVFASTMAAAPLYGHYYCQVKSPCLMGVIPY